MFLIILLLNVQPQERRGPDAVKYCWFSERMCVGWLLSVVQVEIEVRLSQEIMNHEAVSRVYSKTRKRGKIKNGKTNRIQWKYIINTLHVWDSMLHVCDIRGKAKIITKHMQWVRLSLFLTSSICFLYSCFHTTCRNLINLI